MFDSRKATQLAAQFLKKKDGRAGVHWLMKLMYLAERESLHRWHRPFVGDVAYSLPFGPTLSNSYNLLRGEFSNGQDYWSSHVQRDGNTVVRLIRDPGSGLLSKREMRLIDELFDTFKTASFKQMIEYVHNLPEYEDPNGSRKEIDNENLLKLLGKSRIEIKEIRENQKAKQSLQRLLERV